MSQKESVQFNLAEMCQAIRMFLEGAGLDTTSKELENTPEAVAKAWRENFLNGYELDPATVLKGLYESENTADRSEVVALTGIPFHGMCPHHLLPFHGRAYVSYIPGGKLAPLSSLARLVDCFAHRLEIQEHVTRQIAEALQVHLQAHGTAVALQANQTCLTARGMNRRGTTTLTKHFTGEFINDTVLRSEFMKGIE